MTADQVALQAEEDRRYLNEVVDHLAHFLPAQAPIGVFIHHNTLHAFQHLKFEDAVKQAAELYGTEPYMREDAYRAQLSSGRILADDIDAVLDAELNVEILPSHLDRRMLRRAMLDPGVRRVSPETVRYLLEESDFLTRYRRDLPSDARKSLGPDSPTEVQRLFDACVDSVPTTLFAQDRKRRRPIRPRDGILPLYGEDLDDIVHPLLIRLSGAYLDQGIAYWPMPDRDGGFLAAARSVLTQPSCILPQNLDRLPAILSRHAAANLGAEETIVDVLRELAVSPDDWEELLEAEMLALPGWAGMMRRLEEEPELAPHRVLPASLMDFLALRLTLNLAAMCSIAGNARNWRQGTPAEGSSHLAALAAAATVFDAAQLAGISPGAFERLSTSLRSHFVSEVSAFDHLERRRVLHLAYERHHERQILLPLLEHHRTRVKDSEPIRVAAQVFFCLDEREESIRRQLEETDPEIETFGTAGFYGAAIHYTGIDDAHGVSLCPVIVKPQHAVLERALLDNDPLLSQRKAMRKVVARITRGAFVSSRTLVRGWISTVAWGMFSVFPLATHVLAPRRYARWMAWLNNAFLPEPQTELAFMRGEADAEKSHGFFQGFTIQEKIDRVAGVLGPAGLRKDMARLVVVLGHGSTSLNNPHESAHDCGACGGRRGGPNGRLFAAMANHPEVRLGLRAKGIHIPEDTWFVGGYHDTCNDNVDIFDLESVPQTHRGDLARVRASLDRARALSAHERARRFEAAGKHISPKTALHHMQERAGHLAEPRPEYGHCTNAITFVGRRSQTRGLFFDRRAFLVSYDAAQDPTNESLERLLGPVIPVCAGISLEYFFSFVDNEGYSCGTKLPHNVTGLIGVMNGYESDLRTGLPWQMVEIHEPVRSLFVIETTPELVMAAIWKSALLTEFLENRWIRLATADPVDGTIRVYRDGEFELLEGAGVALRSFRSSAEWYDVKLEHLGWSVSKRKPREWEGDGFEPGAIDADVASRYCGRTGTGFRSSGTAVAAGMDTAREGDRPVIHRGIRDLDGRCRAAVL